MTRPAALAAACLAALSTAHAAPVTYAFTTAGFEGGGTVAGTFVAEDLDGDGQISLFDGEVFDAAATFLGSTVFPEIVFGFADLFGLVYDLDGTIGDGETGDIEGLGFFGANGFALDIGAGPVALCDGTVVCAVISDGLSTLGSSRLTLVTVAEGAVPVPGALAFFATGMLGAGALRARARS